MGKLALLGGSPVRKNKLQYISSIGEEEEKAVLDVLKSKRLSGFYQDFEGGEKVKEFEERWSEYFGIKHSITMNSGTSALHAAIASTGVGPGDEVIVTAYSFTATASCIVMNNAVPIFCDIDPNTYNISTDKIESLITENTKVIVVVHLFGQSAQMDEIMRIANKYNLLVVEDACQAPGTKFRDELVGTIGHLGVFSTVETKNLVTGEGGIVITDNDDFAHKCKLVRNHGEAWMAGKPRAYLSNTLGYNYRMTEIQAAIGIEQLKKLDNLNATRNELAKFLMEELKDLNGISLPSEINDSQTIHHLLCLQFEKEKLDISRETFIEAMGAEGIPVSKGYPHPMYLNPLFTEKIAFGNSGCPFTCPLYGKEINYGIGLCPDAEKVCEKSIFFQHIRYPHTIGDMKDSITAFKKVIAGVSELTAYEQKMRMIK